MTAATEVDLFTLATKVTRRGRLTEADRTEIADILNRVAAARKVRDGYRDDMSLSGPFRIWGRVGGRRNPEGGPVITLIVYLIVAVVVVVYGVGWLLVAAGTGVWHLGVLAVQAIRGKAGEQQ